MFYNCEYFSLKLWFPLALILFVSENKIALAQIVPDNTLPQNSVVTPNGDIIEITGGTARGNNLFHSFEQFSVLVDESASFNNAATIENIIGRVTGSSISEIDGLIRANGTANLFFINPNEIIFGENAALDIGGSFIGSTADSINFVDGTEFSAVNPNASPLLTINIPIGLQYGQNNGDITVRGTGNNLFINFDTFTVDRSDRPTGLSVHPDKTLALVGGNVFLEGANLTAPQGNIELGSVAGGTVHLVPDDLGWKLDYELADSFNEIALFEAASLEASGNSGGRVRVKGGFVSLSDGSAILTDTLGDGTGGSLNIEAEETEIYGAAENGFTSSLFTNVDLGATGDGGNALIDTGYLYVGDGAQVNVNTFGLGNAGTLTVKAGDIEILGGSFDGEFPSGLFSQADIGQTGTGGDIEIEADYLLVADGAQINVNTFGKADAGNITVTAGDIEIFSGSADFGSSGLFASSEDLGNGGNITIDSDYLLVADGAQIITASFFDGDAGNLAINSDEIELVGTSPGGTPSALFGTIEEGATGNGGSLQIDATNLLVSDGAQIAVSTAGSGNGGTLDINASNVELVGFGDSGSSGLFSNAIIDSGDGGDINLTSDRLSLTDGATISVSNFASRNSDIPPGMGAAGNINIEVNSLELDSNVTESSTITAAAFARSGGNITLNINSDFSLSNGSRVTAETRGDGDGGSIDISAERFDLNTQGVSVNSTGLGQAGDIAIASDLLTLNNGNITATSTFSGGGDINLTTNSLNLDNNSLISTSVLDSTGGGGNIDINNDGFIIGSNDSNIKADAVLGNGGNIQITSQGLFFDASSQITASSEFGVDGVVEVNDLEAGRLNLIQLSQNVSTSETVVTSNCPAPEQNTFAVTGLGGIPENPDAYLRGRTLWQDARRLTNDPNPDSISKHINDTQSASVDKIVESKGWIINQRGNVELVAASVPTIGHQGIRCSGF